MIQLVGGRRLTPFFYANANPLRLLTPLGFGWIYRQGRSESCRVRWGRTAINPALTLKVVGATDRKSAKADLGSVTRLWLQYTGYPSFNYRRWSMTAFVPVMGMDADPKPW